MHLNPAAAVRCHQDTGARRSLAMHWGTFQLPAAGRADPSPALIAARTAAGRADPAFEVAAPGATVTV